MSILKKFLFGFVTMGANYGSINASNALPGRAETLKVG